MVLERQRIGRKKYAKELEILIGTGFMKYNYIDNFLTVLLAAIKNYIYYVYIRIAPSSES